MTDQALNPGSDHLDISDVERRLKAIFIGSVGNLVEWYDFYAYAAFALYFAPSFFPGEDPVVQQLNAAVLFAIGTQVVYHDQPLSMDEYAPYFQSQLFASGHLSAHFPVDMVNLLVPAPFQNYFLSTSTSTGDVASKYWPSFALLLTPFTLLCISWACNGVLSGLTIARRV